MKTYSVNKGGISTKVHHHSHKFRTRVCLIFYIQNISPSKKKKRYFHSSPPTLSLPLFNNTLYCLYSFIHPPFAFISILTQTKNKDTPIQGSFFMPCVSYISFSLSGGIKGGKEREKRGVIFFFKKRSLYPAVRGGRQAKSFEVLNKASI